MRTNIIIPNKYAYHDKPQSYRKLRPNNFTYTMKIKLLKYGDLIFEISWLNSIGSILRYFSKLQIEILIIERKSASSGAKSLNINLILMSLTQIEKQKVQLYCKVI